MSSFAILLPVYNGRPYLERCIESVLAQTHRDFELWIGDDGSTDNSRAYLDSLRDPRLRFCHGERRGLFANLNALFDGTRAPIVRVLCQDDILEPNCLAEELAFFARHPEIGMTFTKSSLIDAHGAILQRGAFGDLPEVMPPLLTLQHLYYHGCFPGNLSTVAFRRELAGTGFDTSFEVSADYELWLRLGWQKPVGVIHQHLVQIRNHAGQLSMARASGLRFIVENRRIRRIILPLLPPHAQAGARHYERVRHDVLDFHYTLRCLLAGRWLTAVRAWRAIGPARSLQAAAWWAWTMNNHRYRPQADWILPTSASWPADERLLKKNFG